MKIIQTKIDNIIPYSPIAENFNIDSPKVYSSKEESSCWLDKSFKDIEKEEPEFVRKGLDSFSKSLYNNE